MAERPRLERFLDDGLWSYLLQDDCWWLRGREGSLFGITDEGICVDGPEGSDQLANGVAGLWLRRQGFLVLHANAVEKDGRALLLMGASGAGKTTLTRALLGHGFRLVTDDLGVVDLGAETPRLLPGPGRVKVRTGVLDAPKRLEPVPAVEDATPVAAAVIVEPQGPVNLRQVGGAAASLAFVQHAQMPRSLSVTG
ncbi:MAG: hypothetical protein HKN29_04510, partial [Rhodothermales bacterium]|nr:hypothetical protein [Rhodothermales bacterium]